MCYTLAKGEKITNIWYIYDGSGYMTPTSGYKQEQLFNLTICKRQKWKTLYMTIKYGIPIIM